MDAFIRPAVPTDAAGISTVIWTSRQHAMPWLAERHTEAQIQHWVAHVLLPTTTVWVVEQQGRLVGFTALGQGILDQLYVMPGHQGQGIGARLLATAREAAGDRLSLYAFARNAGARRFYERHGFTVAKESGSTHNEGCEPDMLYEWHRTGLPGGAA